MQLAHTLSTIARLPGGTATPVGPQQGRVGSSAACRKRHTQCVVLPQTSSAGNAHSLHNNKTLGTVRRETLGRDRRLASWVKLGSKLAVSKPCRLPIGGRRSMCAAAAARLRLPHSPANRAKWPHGSMGATKYWQAPAWRCGPAGSRQHPTRRPLPYLHNYLPAYTHQATRACLPIQAPPHT